MENENLDGVLKLVDRICLLLPKKNIWLYSGYQWSDIWDYGFTTTDIYNNRYGGWTICQLKRQDILKQCKVFVDGKYIDSQRDISKKWAGSSNQRVIDIQKSLQQGEVVLYCD